MNLNAPIRWLMTLLLAAAALPMAAAPARAADQVPWVPDFQAACGMAAEQHRLVLLHFYNDNCGPCVRVDQNVFSRPEVAEAVSQNYIGVKVHAGKSPQLATRYRVQQWPTDVFVTPSGLEVFRTISPQKPDDYIAVLSQVARQTGVGAARQWKAQMGQTLAAAANSAQQSAVAAGQWSQQAKDAVQQYEKQAGDSYKQFRQQADETARQVQTQAEQTKSQWQATAQKATEEVGEAAHGLKDQMQQVTQTLLDRRSAYIPADQSPATQPSPAPASNGQTASHGTQTPAANQNSPAAAAPAPAEMSAPALTTNPWVAGNQPAVSSAPSTANAAASPAPPFVPAQPQATGGPQDSSLANRQMVPVSQAPAIALDGFCPVTLREVIEQNPGDRAAWKKGDRRFGAVHNGRTYLFVSAEQQQKFLANPDGYAPVMSGYDPVLFAERGQMVDGKRAYGLITADKQIYLFADEASLNRFKQSPENYAGAIQQARARAEGGNLYR